MRVFEKIDLPSIFGCTIPKMMEISVEVAFIIGDKVVNKKVCSKR